VRPFIPFTDDFIPKPVRLFQIKVAAKNWQKGSTVIFVALQYHLFFCSPFHKVLQYPEATLPSPGQELGRTWINRALHTIDVILD